MPEQPLNEHLRRYYTDKKPSPQCLDRLIALAESTQTAESSAPETSPATKTRHATPMYLAVAASLLLVLLGSGVFLLQKNDSIDPSWLVAKEIAVNHNKHLAIEFSTGDYRELNRLMDKLDFSGVVSKRLAPGEYRLLGGRYCSIQGQLALQLKLQDRAGNLYTLYQAPLNKILTSIQQGEQLIDGLHITLWREAGLLLGLAGSPALAPEDKAGGE
ncbi:MAG TPA: hypothetical protein ENI94_08490 [Gammaproteobacteria bacterium]|nr:hypothetical protein [Gammaproteobacteria bacterium]